MEFRQNLATREWILFAPERAKRPDQYRATFAATTHVHPSWRRECPFCPGNEEHTQGETYRIMNEHGQWQARSFPNAYPTVHPDGSPVRVGSLFRLSMSAVGHHEVVAESPLHNTTLGLQPLREVQQVLDVWSCRVASLRTLRETELVIVFKNHGERAGTSIEHPHSQIVSLPITPSQIRHRAEDAMRFYDDFGECVMCRSVEAERKDRVRIVRESEHFTAFVPYASYSPFSVWIVSHRHYACISESRDEELDDLADVLRDVLSRVYFGLGDPSYNLVVRLANRDCLHTKFFHWYLAIIPRLQRTAGFEMATGMFINTSLPENDAAFLRGVNVPDLLPVVPATGDAPVAGPVGDWPLPETLLPEVF